MERFTARGVSFVTIGSALRVEGLDVEAAIGALRGAGVRPFFAALLPQASFAPGADPRAIQRALERAATDRDVETVVAVSRTALSSDRTAVAASVAKPALVATGELDATCPVAAGAEMARVLHAEHIVLPGRGHVAPLEDAAAVAELVQAFVAAREESA